MYLLNMTQFVDGHNIFSLKHYFNDIRIEYEREIMPASAWHVHAERVWYYH